MARTHLVNGIRVSLTAEEEIARDAEEAQAVAERPTRRRTSKQRTFIEEGVKRIAIQVADWDTLEAIKVIAGMWPAISATATPAQTTAKDIYLFVRDTVPAKLALLTNEIEFGAVDPTLSDPFGDGTTWPT